VTAGKEDRPSRDETPVQQNKRIEASGNHPSTKNPGGRLLKRSKETRTGRLKKNAWGGSQRKRKTGDTKKRGNLIKEVIIEGRRAFEGSSGEMGFEPI